MDTKALDAILLRLPDLSEDEVRVLHAAWEGGDVALRSRAWQHGKRNLAERGSDGILRGAQDQVQRWMRDYASGRSATPTGIDPSFVDVQRLDVRIAAAPAILDALLGVLVGDELDEDEREELMRPWEEATTPPVPVGGEWADPDASPFDSGPPGAGLTEPGT